MALVHTACTIALNSHDAILPNPWQRYVDDETRLIYYRNPLDGSTVVDLRPKVDIGEIPGGGPRVRHLNAIWYDLEILYLNDDDMDISDSDDAGYDDEDCGGQEYSRHPFMMHAVCCGVSPSFYLLMPERLVQCPVCCGPIIYGA